MATYYLSPISTVLQAFTSQGVVLAGGSITSYLAGTTTPTTTWTDITGVTPNGNPITLDSAGRPPSMIWQQSRVPIKAIFKDAAGNQVGPTYDQISGIGDPGTSLNSFYGTDSGSANAYLLTVANANFTSYTDGIIIYWKPLNANTTVSTVSVNGLGAVNLTYADGSALTSGALAAGGLVQIMCLSGNFYVISSANVAYSAGSFTPTWSGFLSAPTGSVSWTKIGNLVTLKFGPNCTGTSNTTDMSMSGLPSNIRPPTGAYPYVPMFITDSGAQAMGGIAFGPGAGAVQFYKGTAPPSSSGFTNPGTKGVNQGVAVTYSL